MEEAIQQIVLQGKLIDLKEAQEETKVEEWQTNSLKKQIEKAGLRKKGFTMPLDGEDVTEKEYPLAKAFFPEIQLSGIELRGERNSKAWGGSYFRIIKDRINEDRRVIQWIYVWTKQRFFVSFWVTVLPLFVLGIIALLIYSFLDFSRAIISVIAIASVFLVVGFIQLVRSLKGLSKGAFYFSNQHLFLVFGGIFLTLLGEIYYSKGLESENILPGARFIHPDIPIGDIVEPIIQRSLKFTWVAAIFFALTIIALILWKWEPPSFTHATHDMDWAPFFIYVHKTSKGWELDKVRYDAFHYYAETMTLDELKRKNAVRKGSPMFEIPNFWHSFKPNTGINSWFKVILGLITVLLGLALGFIAFRAIEGQLLASEVWRFVIIPMILFVGAYLTFSNWPTPIVKKKKIEFSDPRYYLTENRVKIFWNLKGEEPALKVRSKLQDPFMEDEFFSTFRDDLEQIVLYSLLPKIVELERAQQEDFFERL